MDAARLCIAAALIAGCGGDGGGDDYMAATIDGQQWRATGQGSALTTASGVTSLTILGYTPLGGGSRQADGTKPQIDIVFETVPPVGSYDIPAFTALSIVYSPSTPMFYGAMTGTVRISRINADLAEGTFAFVAPRSQADPQPVNVTDGSFHVPIGP
jgi:hypothetical protein